MATIEILMTREEIIDTIPYDMICMTRYGTVWRTMARKRLWDIDFSDKEKEEAEKIFKLCHSWFVGKGIPDTVRMDFYTYRLWRKIEEFCCCFN